MSIVFLLYDFLLLSGGSSGDTSTIGGTFTFYVDNLPSRTRWNDGSASKNNYGQANSTTCQPRKHFCKVLCTNLLRKGSGFEYESGRYAFRNAYNRNWIGIYLDAVRNFLFLLLHRSIRKNRSDFHVSF